MPIFIGCGHETVVRGDVEKKGERLVFRLQWKVHTRTSLPNTSSTLYWVEKKFEKFENGNTKIMDGKRGTKEVEPWPHQFSHINLEDKVLLQGRANDGVPCKNPHLHQVTWLWKLRTQVKSM
jgi:hypothetical protein